MSHFTEILNTIITRPQHHRLSCLYCHRFRMILKVFFLCLNCGWFLRYFSSALIVNQSVSTTKSSFVLQMMWISCKVKWIRTAVPISEYYFFWLLSDPPRLMQKGPETVYIEKGSWCCLRPGTIYEVHVTCAEPFKIIARTFGNLNHQKHEA